MQSRCKTSRGAMTRSEICHSSLRSRCREQRENISGRGKVKDVGAKAFRLLDWWNKVGDRRTLRNTYVFMICVPYVGVLGTINTSN